MDYSSAADQPIAKSFDGIIENDPKGKFLLDNSAKCFNLCVTKITESPLNETEVGCLKECYVKSFYSSTLGNNLI
jgi:hypothetical protein